MKVELAQDPLFDKLEAPIRELKEKQLERQRQNRILRMNPMLKTQQIVLKEESNEFDPLIGQLQQFKEDFSYKKTHKPSKASYNLKKYIIKQERNLKSLRVDHLENESNLSKNHKKEADRKRYKKLETDNNEKKKSSVRKDTLAGDFDQTILKQFEKIHIPCIDEMFKNQHEEFLLFESRRMMNTLDLAIKKVETGTQNVLNTINQSLKMTKPKSRGKHQQKLPHLPHPPSLSKSKDSPRNSRMNSSSQKNGRRNSKAIIENISLYSNEEDVQIDKIIEKKLGKSKKLQDKLNREKKEMRSKNFRFSHSADNKPAFFLGSDQEEEKVRKKYDWVKSISFRDDHRELEVTKASVLLFNLGRMMKGKTKKQRELARLLQNSYQNRSDILERKQQFYSSSSVFKNLSPSKQFKLRQNMNKKLNERLQRSKQQVSNFIAVLHGIKENYHAILNKTILLILKEVRETLMTGRVMKSSDLQAILSGKDEEELDEYPNQQILVSLEGIMVL